MKHYHTFLVCFLLSLMFSSCGDDIDSINGEWSLISYISEGTSTNSYDGQKYDLEHKAVGENFDYTLEFKNENFTGLGFFELDVIKSGHLTTQLDSATAAQFEELYGPFEPITPITEYSANGTYSLKDGKLITSETVFGTFGSSFFITSSPIEYKYELNGDELTIINHKESSYINRDGIEASSNHTKTTKWVKQ